MELRHGNETECNVTSDDKSKKKFFEKGAPQDVIKSGHLTV
jgi:hypothetical protein